MSCGYFSIFIAFFGQRSSQILQIVHESESTISGWSSLRLKTAMAQQSTQVYERQSLHFLYSILIFIEGTSSLTSRLISIIKFKDKESSDCQRSDELKIGTVIYEPVRVDGFDISVYYSKRVDGVVGKPAKGMYNDITCFVDAKSIRERPELVALSENGPATRINKAFTLPWDFVCPTNVEYQKNLLRFIKETVEQDVKGIILNLYHFPEEGFCTCDHCTRLQRESGLDFLEWRAQTVTDFIRRGKELVKQPFGIEIWPDPVLARQRFGLDFEALAKYVDFFHVPLSAHNYVTMYWVDTLTRDFVKLLNKPIFIELSAEISGEIETKALLRTIAYVSSHDVEAILLLVHDADRAKEICRNAVKDSNYRGWLKKFEFKNMTKIIERWEKIY